MDIQITEPAREQSRARYPDSSGYIKRDGVRLYYEVYGSGEPTVFLLPTWSIIHSRHWKMQIPYLARHCRVVTFDGRGNGRSDRPAAGYQEAEFAADAAGGDGCHRDRAGDDRVAVGRRAARSHPGGRASGPGDRGRVHLPGRAARLAAGGPHALPVGRGAAHRRGLAEGQRSPAGCGTTAASWSSSSPRCSPSRTRPSRSRTASAGAWRPPPRPSSRRKSVTAWTSLPRASCAPGSAARCW